MTHSFANGSFITLPGFLGLPKDWTDVVPSAIIPSVPILPFWEAADWLNQWALSFPAPRILAGYSMGGRVALHALVKDPAVWSGGMILSAHTGLKTSEEKALRLGEDLRWGERFKNDPWEPLLADWDQRGALKSSKRIERREADYCRYSLARALDIWSLARQDDLRPEIERLQIPVDWFTGEKDVRFSEIARSLKLRHASSRVVVIPNVGHRLLNASLRPYFFPQSVQEIGD